GDPDRRFGGACPRGPTEAVGNPQRPSGNDRGWGAGAGRENWEEEAEESARNLGSNTMRLVGAGLAAPAPGARRLIAGCSSQAPSSQVRQWDAELQRLQTEQDSLRSVANEIVKNDSLVQSLPPGDAVIRIPTSFVRSVIQQVLRDVASHVTLRLGG